VSICVPVYNGAKYLAEALDSALSQTYEEFELLLADDRSTDDTASIIEIYAKQDKRIKAWTNKKNLGHYGNYNACISKATGKYIKLFAQDDILHPQMLDRFVSVFDHNPAVSLINCARRWIDAAGEEIKAESASDILLTKPFVEDTKLSGTDAIVWTLKEGFNPLGEPSSQMYRAEFIDGGFDESFRQIGDLEHNIRVLQHGDFYFVADELCQFRRHADSWTTANSFVLSTHLEWLLLASKCRDYLPKAGLTPEGYCLNFLKAWTRNLEERIYRDHGFERQKIEAVLHELCQNADPLSLFECAKSGERNLASEYRAFGAIALLHSVLLENQLRLANEEAAIPYTEVAENCNNLSDLRPGMVAALAGLRRTLRERDKEIAALRKALDEMGSSLSWKLTEPLRKIRANFH
jgi:glycosyltransferase involved in cell wall biosynthesis